MIKEIQKQVLKNLY